MATFNGTDYDKLFSFGQELYASDITTTRRKEIAVTLMAMAESVRGQYAYGRWPCITARYRHLTQYPAPQYPDPGCQVVKLHDER